MVESISGIDEANQTAPTDITFSISDMQLEDVLLFIHIPLSYTLTINLCESLKIVHFSYFYSIIFMRLINMDQWLIYLIIQVVTWMMLN